MSCAIHEEEEQQQGSVEQRESEKVLEVGLYEQQPRQNAQFMRHDSSKGPPGGQGHGLRLSSCNTCDGPSQKFSNKS